MSYVDIMRRHFTEWVQIWVHGNHGEPKNDDLRDVVTTSVHRGSWYARRDTPVALAALSMARSIEETFR